jgi:hypothetical protein
VAPHEPWRPTSFPSPAPRPLPVVAPRPPSQGGGGAGASRRLRSGVPVWWRRVATSFSTGQRGRIHGAPTRDPRRLRTSAAAPLPTSDGGPCDDTGA